MSHKNMLLKAAALTSCVALTACATTEGPAPKVAGSVTVPSASLQLTDRVLSAERAPMPAQAPADVAQAAVVPASLPAAEIVEAQPMPDAIVCRVGNTKGFAQECDQPTPSETP